MGRRCVGVTRAVPADSVAYRAMLKKDQSIIGSSATSVPLPPHLDESLMRLNS